jgi:hypothetical protein
MWLLSASVVAALLLAGGLWRPDDHSARQRRLEAALRALHTRGWAASAAPAGPGTPAVPARPQATRPAAHRGRAIHPVGAGGSTATGHQRAILAGADQGGACAGVADRAGACCSAAPRSSASWPLARYDHKAGTQGDVYTLTSAARTIQTHLRATILDHDPAALALVLGGLISLARFVGDNPIRLLVATGVLTDEEIFDWVEDATRRNPPPPPERPGQTSGAATVR